LFVTPSSQFSRRFSWFCPANFSTFLCTQNANTDVNLTRDTLYEKVILLSPGLFDSDRRPPSQYRARGQRHLDQPRRRAVGLIRFIGFSTRARTERHVQPDHFRPCGDGLHRRCQYKPGLDSAVRLDGGRHRHDWGRSNDVHRLGLSLLDRLLHIVRNFRRCSLLNRNHPPFGPQIILQNSVVVGSELDEFEQPRKSPAQKLVASSTEWDSSVGTGTAKGQPELLTGFERKHGESRRRVADVMLFDAIDRGCEPAA
jgi:hypothetical protein